ncbi:MAG TPA: hypothetical protein PKX00_10605 [Opitutaceae bacterium]|nr:hypothetical protein [Opitutaceae bacterium]
MSRCIALASTLLALCGLLHPTQAASPKEVAGIYPHLALYNQHGECGTGAVVPWAGRLWVITYGPHFPKGSTDRLYSIDSALTLTAHPESVGGTPANRMIHSESQQLLIGPYVINAQGGVRVIPPTLMYGRLTGNARHLTDPAHKVYYATMEEGFYEVDMATLAVTELFRDEQLKEPARRAYLPGYHGKGLYSGQGLLIYANNGAARPTEARHSERRARHLGRHRFRLECGAAQPVHRSDRTRRTHRQRRPRPRSRLVDRLGSPLTPAARARPRPVAPVPPAQGQPQLRWCARLEHRMAAHP